MLGGTLDYSTNNLNDTEERLKTRQQGKNWGLNVPLFLLSLYERSREAAMMMFVMVDRIVLAT